MAVTRRKHLYYRNQLVGSRPAVALCGHVRPAAPVLESHLRVCRKCEKRHGLILPDELLPGVTYFWQWRAGDE